MEPVRTHRFTPVTRNVDNPTVSIRHTCTRIGGIGVDGVMTGKDHRPAVVKVLSREEEGVGVAIAFCRVVTVVLVNGEGVKTKSPVGPGVERQAVPKSHQDRLTVSDLQQFRREGSVKGPQGIRILRRHQRMEFHGETIGRSGTEAEPIGVVVGVVVKSTRSKFAVIPGKTMLVTVVLHRAAESKVGSGTGDHRLEDLDRRELGPALVRPAFTGRAPFAGEMFTGASQVRLDTGLPRVLCKVVTQACGFRGQRLVKKHLDLRSIGAILCGQLWRRDRQSIHIKSTTGQGVGLCSTWVGHRIQSDFILKCAELLEAQHLLIEILGTKHRTRKTTGRQVKNPALQKVRFWNGVVLPDQVMGIRDTQWAFNRAVHHVVHARRWRDQLFRNHQWDKSRVVDLWFTDDKRKRKTCSSQQSQKT